MLFVAAKLGSQLPTGCAVIGARVASFVRKVALLRCIWWVSGGSLRWVVGCSWHVLLIGNLY